MVDREVEYILNSIAEAVTFGITTRTTRTGYPRLPYLRQGAPAGFHRSASGRSPTATQRQMPALMYDLADRIGDVFTEQFGKAGYDPKSAPIYAHALVGMVAFVGQWWTEGDKPPPVETVASHIAALAWTGLRQLPKKPSLLK